MTSMIKCPICLEYETTKNKQGSMNLHMYHCENKQLRNGKPKEERKQVEKGCSGGCTWVMLNPQINEQKKAIEGGYNKVCLNCMEIQ